MARQSAPSMEAAGDERMAADLGQFASNCRAAARRYAIAAIVLAAIGLLVPVLAWARGIPLDLTVMVFGVFAATLSVVPIWQSLAFHDRAVAAERISPAWTEAGGPRLRALARTHLARLTGEAAR